MQNYDYLDDISLLAQNVTISKKKSFECKFDKYKSFEKQTIMQLMPRAFTSLNELLAFYERL